MFSVGGRAYIKVTITLNPTSKIFLTFYDIIVIYYYVLYMLYIIIAGTCVRTDPAPIHVGNGACHWPHCEQSWAFGVPGVRGCRICGKCHKRIKVNQLQLIYRETRSGTWNHQIFMHLTWTSWRTQGTAHELGSSQALFPLRGHTCIPKVVKDAVVPKYSTAAQRSFGFTYVFLMS